MAKTRKPIVTDCGCPPPFCTRVADELDTSVAYSCDGMVAVIRSLDCCFHGPQVLRLQIMPSRHDLDRLLAGRVLLAAPGHCGKTRNATMAWRAK